MKCLPIRRAFLLFLSCVLLLSALSGCGSSEESQVIVLKNLKEEQETRTKLTFFGFKADSINLTAIEAALQGYMAEHEDVTVTYEGIKGTAYYDALALREETGNLDDVFMLDHDRIVQFTADGKLADLSDIPGLDSYTEAVREQFTSSNGAVYFIPACISTYNLYVNYDLLKEHGQKVPENWAEFQQVCDYFVSQGIVPLIGNNYESLPTVISGRGLFSVYQQPNAAEIVRSYNEDINALAEALAPGVELAAEMIERGWFDPDEVLATAQTSDDLVLFAQGDRPFMITGGWATVRLPSKGVDFEYGVHPYPILEDGSLLSMQVDTCIGVSAESDNREAAKDFVSYLILPDTMWAYCDSQASFTPLQDERIPSETTLAPSFEYLTNGRVSMRSDTRINLPMTNALMQCADVLLSGGSAAEAKETLLETLAG